MVAYRELFQFEKQLEDGFLEVLKPGLSEADFAEFQDFSAASPANWTAGTGSAVGNINKAGELDTYQVSSSLGVGEVYYTGLATGASYTLTGSLYQETGAALNIEITGERGVSLATIAVPNATWTAFSETVVTPNGTLGFYGEVPGSGSFWIDDNMLISGGSIGANVYSRRSTQTKTSPYVDVMVSIGAAQDHLHHFGSGETAEDIYEGTLEVLISTQRSDANSQQLHYGIMGTVRSNLRSSNSAFNNSNFPNIKIVEIHPTGSSTDVDQDTGLDETTIQLGFVFAIEPSAWPA